jgi:hypothetical protein
MNDKKLRNDLIKLAKAHPGQVREALLPMLSESKPDYTTGSLSREGWATAYTNHTPKKPAPKKVVGGYIIPPSKLEREYQKALNEAEYEIQRISDEYMASFWYHLVKFFKKKLGAKAVGFNQGDTPAQVLFHMYSGGGKGKHGKPVGFLIRPMWSMSRNYQGGISGLIDIEVHLVDQNKKINDFKKIKGFSPSKDPIQHIESSSIMADLEALKNETYAG